MNKDFEINEETTLVRDEKVVFSEVDGEIVMMSIEKGMYYGFDTIGSEIWSLLETPQKVATIINWMMEQYKVDYQTCKNDVIEILYKLHEIELLYVNEE